MTPEQSLSFFSLSLFRSFSTGKRNGQLLDNHWGLRAYIQQSGSPFLLFFVLFFVIFRFTRKEMKQGLGALLRPSRPRQKEKKEKTSGRRCAVIIIMKKTKKKKKKLKKKGKK